MLGICLSFEFSLFPRDPASDRQYIEIHFDHFDLLLLQYMCSFVYNNISVLFGSWSKLVGFFEFKTFDKSFACFFISTLSLQLSLVCAPNENLVVTIHGCDAPHILQTYSLNFHSYSRKYHPTMNLKLYNTMTNANKQV